MRGRVDCWIIFGLRPLKSGAGQIVLPALKRPRIVDLGSCATPQHIAGSPFLEKIGAIGNFAMSRPSVVGVPQDDSKAECDAGHDYAAAHTNSVLHAFGVL